MPANLDIGISVETTKLSTGFAIAKAEFKSATAEVSSFAKQIAQTSDEAIKAKLVPSLQSAIVEAAKARAEMSAFKGKLAEVGQAKGLGGFVNSIKESGEGIEQLTGKLTAVSGLISGIGELFAVGFGVERVYSAIEGYAEFGEKLAHLHEETGLSVEDASALANAASHADVGFDQLARSLGKFATATATAQSGSGEAANAFRGLGITQEELTAHGNDAAAMLTLVAQHLAQYADGETKLAYTEAIFGSRQKEMLLVLNQLGSEGFDGLREKAQALGVLFSGELAERASGVQQQLKDLGAEAQAAGIAFGDAFGPFLIGALTKDLELLQAMVGVSKNFNEEAVRLRESGDAARPILDLTKQIAEQKERIASGNFGWFGNADEARDQLQRLQAQLVNARAQFKETVATPHAEEPKTEKPKLGPLGPQHGGDEDPASKEFVKQIDADIKRTQDAGNMLGEAGKKFELQFLQSARSQAASYGNTDAVDELTSKILALRNEMQKTGLGEQKKDLSGWLAAYSAGIQEQVSEARGNFAQQEALIGDWEATAERLYGKNSSQFAGAEKAMTKVHAAEAAEQLKITDEGLQGQLKAMEGQEKIDLAGTQKKARGILADPEELAAEQAQIIASSAVAESQIELQREAAAKDDLALQKSIEKQRVELVQSAEAEIVKIQRDAAEQSREEWDKVNKEIGDSLSSSIMDALEGKKGGFGAGLKKALDEQLSKMLSSGIGSTLSAGESALGIDKDKQSPGGLAGAGLDSLGLGGIGKFLGLGGEQQDKNQPLITSQAQVVTALNALKAQLVQSAHATAQGAGSAAQAGQQQNTNAMQQLSNETGDLADLTGQHSAATEILGVATKLNTLALLPNTIATIAQEVATWADVAVVAINDVKPFADGGAPPVGRPSLVGESGPEMFVPNESGYIYPSHRLPSYATGDYGSAAASAASTTNYSSARGGDTTNASVTQNINIHPTTAADFKKSFASLVSTHGRSGARAILTQLAKQ